MGYLASDTRVVNVQAVFCHVGRPVLSLHLYAASAVPYGIDFDTSVG